MTAEIIPFPVKQKYTVNGEPVMPPANGIEYLDLCQRFLTHEDYSAVQFAILNPKLYGGLDEGLQLIVDCFYDLEAMSYGK